jgi:hypothetical protein
LLIRQKLVSIQDRREPQNAMQETIQGATPAKPARQYNFRPGVSANPSGMSRPVRRYREFLALFVETHQRKPNAVEDAMLRNAGTCAARSEDKRRAQVEHIVRCGRLLQQLLDKLGLAGPPPPPTPVPLRERLGAK